MVFSFLLSYKILNEAFIVKKTDLAFVCSQAINNVFEILDNYKEKTDLCAVYSPSQTLDKISNSLDDEQKIRFFNAIKREGATQGVIGFQPEGLDTLSESAKNLSFSKYSIVIISEDNEKYSIHKNNRISVLNPKEFLELSSKAKDLYELLSQVEDNLDYIDCLILVFFREGAYERIKSIF